MVTIKLDQAVMIRLPDRLKPGNSYRMWRYKGEMYPIKEGVYVKDLGKGKYINMVTGEVFLKGRGNA
jgi:hypothetical protein